MLSQRYRVLRMEPLVGEHRATERTRPGPGVPDSTPGPEMQAARGFEGQTVTLAQLEGLGRLTWQDDRLAVLDTASESYQVELEPLESPEAQARARAELAEIEATRAAVPSGTEWPWIRVLLVALVPLLIGLAIILYNISQWGYGGR